MGKGELRPTVRRAVLTEQTKAKYYGKPFIWGSKDCARIAAFHARKFGWKVPKTGGYNSALGAKQRLAELECETICDLVEKVGMKEIAPAFAMTGDFVSFASDEPIGALGIVVGNGNMMAFHEAAEGLAIVQMGQIDRAWNIWKG